MGESKDRARERERERERFYLEFGSVKCRKYINTGVLCNCVVYCRCVCGFGGKWLWRE